MKSSFFSNYEPIECNNGFRMSVQADKGKYCTPRNNVGPYVEVEIGYPTRVEPLLLPYAEDSSAPTSTVYGWVPVAVMWEVITKNGGIKSGNLPPVTIGG